MFTCRTCKLLKHSQAKRDLHINEEGSLQTYRCEANSTIDALSEWHCPCYWWSIRPSKGFGCKYWQNMNGKHWV